MSVYWIAEYFMILCVFVSVLGLATSSIGSVKFISEEPLSFWNCFKPSDFVLGRASNLVLGFALCLSLFIK